MSTNNEEVQLTSIVSPEIGGNEFAANALGNNVASSIRAYSSLKEEAVATSTALDDDQRGNDKCIRYPSTMLLGFVTNTIQKVSPSFSPLSSTSSQTSGTSYPKAHFVNCDRLFVGHRNFLAAITTTSKTQSFDAAMKDLGWQEAM